MDLIEKLKSLNVEITPEIEKALKGDYISVQEHEKKLGKVETERDKLKEDYESAKATLEGFEGKDFDAITKDRDEWKAKAEQSEKDYLAKLSARDYSDAIKELIKDIKFTSNSAKKSFMSDLESNPLQMRDGKVLGFDDYLKSYMETDAEAFVKDENPNRSQFTSSINRQNTGSQGSDLAKMRAVMGLTNDQK